MRRWNNLSCCNLLFFAFYNFSNFNSQRFQKQKLILKGTKCNTRMTDAAEAEVSQPACLPASPSARFRKNLSGLIFISAPAFIAFPEQTSWHETDLFWFQHFENIFHLLFPLPNFHGIFWGFIIPCIALFTVYDLRWWSIYYSSPIKFWSYVSKTNKRSSSLLQPVWPEKNAKKSPDLVTLNLQPVTRNAFINET